MSGGLLLYCLVSFCNELFHTAAVYICYSSISLPHLYDIVLAENTWQAVINEKLLPHLDAAARFVDTTCLIMASSADILAIITCIAITLVYCFHHLLARRTLKCTVLLQLEKKWNCVTHFIATYCIALFGGNKSVRRFRPPVFWDLWWNDDFYSLAYVCV